MLHLAPFSMVSTKFYLDTRRTKAGSVSPLKIAITQSRKVAYITLDVRLTSSQWDSVKEKILNHPDAFILNTYINEEKQKIDSILINLNLDGILTGLNATKIKDKILESLNPAKYPEPALTVSRVLPRFRAL